MLDLSLLIKALWLNKILIFKSIIFFVGFGLIIGFGSTIEYNSSLKLIPSSNEGLKANMGGLSSLAGLAGISLNTTSDNFINPEIYPQITGSTPFLIEILNKEIYFEKLDTTVSTYNYYKNLYRPSLLSYIYKYTVRLPFTIKSLFTPEKESVQLKNDNLSIIRISREDNRLIEKFRENIITKFDNETGVLSISVFMPDRNAVAEMADLTQKLLQEYLIDYKSEKANENLKFIEARYNESRIRYERIQNELANYTDQNQNVRSAIVQIEQQNIKNEYDLAFDIYKNLANQLEQARIKVKEDSHVLTVIDPPKVPIEKSSPKRLMILIIFVFLGFVFGISRIVFNNQILALKEILQSK
jgi:uncharacterized protein involved in exopolysaccharide biosynthesis